MNPPWVIKRIRAHNGQRALCKMCGAGLYYDLPAPASVVKAVSRAFAVVHQPCGNPQATTSFTAPQRMVRSIERNAA